MVLSVYKALCFCVSNRNNSDNKNNVVCLWGREVSLFVLQMVKQTKRHTGSFLVPSYVLFSRARIEPRKRMSLLLALTPKEHTLLWWHPVFLVIFLQKLQQQLPGDWWWTSLCGRTWLWYWQLLWWRRGLLGARPRDPGVPLVGGRTDRRWGSDHGTDMQLQGSQGALYVQPTRIQQYSSPSESNSTWGVQWVWEQPCVNKALTCRAVSKQVAAHICLFASFSILPRCVAPVLNRKLSVCLCNLYTFIYGEWLLTLCTQSRARGHWPRWFCVRTSSIPIQNPQSHSCF